MGKVALLVVDVQRGLVLQSPFKVDNIIDNIGELIKKCRTCGIEVVYVQHNGEEGSSLEKDSEGWQIYNKIAPKNSEKIIDKNKNSAFKDTDLKEYLDEKDIDTIILVGMQTEYCIDTTCKIAYEYGYNIIIPEETNTTFDNEKLTAKDIYEHYNFNIFKDRFATVEKFDKTIERVSKMMRENIYLQISTKEDAEEIRDLMIDTLLEETKWFDNGELPYVPGYSSTEMQKYYMYDNTYYKIMLNDIIIGVILLSYTGRGHCEINRFYIRPQYQGIGIGTRVLDALEEMYPTVAIWYLETYEAIKSSHFFFEKNRFIQVKENGIIRSYEKRIQTGLEEDVIMEDFNEKNFRDCNMKDVDFYEINMKRSNFTNSNLRNSLMQNTVLCQSRFNNVDLSGSIIGDTDLSNLKISQCNIDGMTINGISVEDMIQAYKESRQQIREID